MAAAAAQSDKNITSPKSLKRNAPADDRLSEHRLSKRFNLLNLEHNGGKLYIPVSSDGTTAAAAAAPHSEHMQVEDTRDKVYIHNLDEELGTEDESEQQPRGERLVFLPDIEKRLHGIPRHVLMAGHDGGEQQRDQQHHNQLVLYSVPSSLTIPENQDSVRKAIIESRARARDAASSASRDSMLHDEDEANPTQHYKAPDADEEDDDAMDIR